MDFDRELPHTDTFEPLETTSDEIQGPIQQASPAQGDAPPGRRRRRFKSPRASPAHLQRIEDYRGLVETRGWIFAPPSPPLPLSALLSHLTGKQIESLAKTG